MKGNLAPYAAGLLFLLVLPGIWSFSVAAAAVRRFQSRHLQILPAESKFIGMRDPNGVLLTAGHPVVTCPSCTRPHSARSWRNNRCACMMEPFGRGLLSASDLARLAASCAGSHRRRQNHRKRPHVSLPVRGG